MIKMKNYRDDELIAYLMDEGGSEFRAGLARDLDNDPELAGRLAALGIICNQLRQLPLEAFYPKRKDFSPVSLLVKAVILTGIFFTGVLMQSEFSILNQHATAPVTVNPASSGGDFPFPSQVVM
jgi:hypothetical protein